MSVCVCVCVCVHALFVSLVYAHHVCQDRDCKYVCGREEEKEYVCRRAWGCVCVCVVWVCMCARSVLALVDFDCICICKHTLTSAKTFDHICKDPVGYLWIYDTTKKYHVMLCCHIISHCLQTEYILFWLHLQTFCHICKDPVGNIYIWHYYIFHVILCCHIISHCLQTEYTLLWLHLQTFCQICKDPVGYIYIYYTTILYVYITSYHIISYYILL